MPVIKEASLESENNCTSQPSLPLTKKKEIGFGDEESKGGNMIMFEDEGENADFISDKSING